MRGPRVSTDYEKLVKYLILRLQVSHNKLHAISQKQMQRDGDKHRNEPADIIIQESTSSMK